MAARRYIFSSVFLVFFALSMETNSFTVTNKHLNPEYLANVFGSSLVQQILNKLQSKTASQKENNTGRGNLIPPYLIEPLPDLPLGNGTLNFENLLLEGSYQHGNTKFQGLNTLWDDLLIYIQTPFKVSYAIGFKDLAIRGNYSLNMGINFTYLLEQFPFLGDIIEIPEDEVFISPLVGAGAYELGFQDLHFNVSLAFNIVAGRILGVNTGLALGLGGIRIYFEQLVFNNGIPLEGLWDPINELLTEVILAVWVPIEETITSLLDVVISPIFEGCLIVDFLSGDLSCTGFFPPPATPPPEPIQTTPDAEPEQPTSPDSTTENSSSRLANSVFHSSVLLIPCICIVQIMVHVWQ